jgi:serine phosphatase RsbU (regulator of sigma subunit)
MTATAALEWSVAALPLPGEDRLGDRALVAFADGRTLLGAIDGLGHGAEAAAAADAAIKVLEHSVGQDVVSAVRKCHFALRSTRGAAISLASFDRRHRTMTWLGIGNIEARLLRGAQPAPPAESLLLHGGVVGHDLPQLIPRTMPVTRGDVLIFATDGIDRRFGDFLIPSGTCREIADRILQRYSDGHDDALVLVARCLGTT